MPNLWELYKDRTEHSPLPVAITEGEEHYIRYANPAFISLYRITAKNVSGRPLSELLPEDDGSPIAALLDRVYESGKTESLPDQPGASNGNKSNGKKEDFCSYTVWKVGDDKAPPGVMIQIVDTTESTVEKKQMGAITEALTLFSVKQHEAIEQGEKSRELLALAIRESEHRAKNSLQTVSSLLGLYARSHPEFTAMLELKKIQLHIRTIAAMHELLIHAEEVGSKKSKLSTIKLLKDLLPLWRKTIGIQDNDLKWNTDDFELSEERGVALALIINELICNSLKNGGRSLNLQLKRIDGKARLDIYDDGPGFPHDLDPTEIKSFGLRFVQNTCKNTLNGKISFNNRPAGGALVTIIFPLEEQG